MGRGCATDSRTHRTAVRPTLAAQGEAIPRLLRLASRCRLYVSGEILLRVVGLPARHKTWLYVRGSDAIHFSVRSSHVRVVEAYLPSQAACGLAPD